MTARSTSIWERLAKLLGVKPLSQPTTPEPMFFGGGSGNSGNSGSGGSGQQCDPNDPNCDP